ncbi:MAG: dihydroorotate dehydrogenase electron transfer subunit [Candidatus Zixiibacteriota bacterium]
MLSQLPISVSSKETLQENIFKLTLSSPFISKRAKPGNFVHIRVGSGDNPLLRRAFSIHSIDKNNFDILFRVVGKGTEILSRTNPGERLDILGPIGNNFTLPSKNKEIMLVAGGMGIAPLWFLLTHLKDKGFDPSRITFLYGAKTKGELLCLDKFKKIKVRLILTTDDGSKGKRGLVTDSFLQEIKRRNQDHSNLTVYSCGPEMMLAKMSELAKEFELPCQISLETHMACGVGACWGCAVKSSDGTYRRACADGPVFDAREVNLGI